MATLGTIAVRLKLRGHTVQEMTQLLYGHPGNQSWYTIQRGCLSKAPKGIKGRLRSAGYNTVEINQLVK